MPLSCIEFLPSFGVIVIFQDDLYQSCLLCSLLLVLMRPMEAGIWTCKQELAALFHFLPSRDSGPSRTVFARGLQMWVFSLTSAAIPVRFPLHPLFHISSQETMESSSSPSDPESTAHLSASSCFLETAAFRLANDPFKSGGTWFVIASNGKKNI